MENKKLPVLTFNHKAENFNDAILLNGVTLRDINIESYKESILKFLRSLPSDYSLKEAMDSLFECVDRVDVACATAFSLGMLSKNESGSSQLMLATYMSRCGSDSKSKVAEFIWRDGFLDKKIEPDDRKRLATYFHFIGEILSFL